MARKVLLSSLIAFIDPGNLVQVLVGIIIAGGFLTGHLNAQAS